jgi:hypothetical protein
MPWWLGPRTGWKCDPVEARKPYPARRRTEWAGNFYSLVR